MSRSRFPAVVLAFLLAARASGAQRETRASAARMFPSEDVLETIVVDGADGSYTRQLRRPDDGADRIAAPSILPFGRPAPAASCASDGVQSVAVLLVTFPGVPAPDLSRVTVLDRFFGPAPSLDSYLREVSYGLATATGDVFGWYTLDAAYACSDPEGLRAAAIRAADRDVDFHRYSRIFLVFPGSGSCGWLGMATTGCAPLSSARDGAFTASTSWVTASSLSDPDSAMRLLAHEMGHNLGLDHAAVRRFSGQALGPVGDAGVVDEYGDGFSAMSASSPGHYASPHKDRLGWHTRGVNNVTVEANGVFTLQPLEIQPAGLQALRIRRGTGNDAWIWVSYRQPLGTDATLPPQGFAGAIVHYEDSSTGGKTHLLDFIPGTDDASDAALPRRTTWVDPYSNLTLSVEDASSSGLTIRVSYGAPSCEPAAPTVVVTPPNPTVPAGGEALYTVSVTNNESGGCAPGVFQLSASVPSAWAAAISPPALTLSPRSTGSATLRVTTAPAASAATYAIAASAAKGALAGTGAASCTVTAASLTMTLAAPEVPWTRGDTVPITAVVFLGGAPAVNATVTMTMRKPGGATVVSTLKTGSTGKAVWNYKIGARDPKGTYSVTATASLSGVSTAAGPATFAVN